MVAAFGNLQIGVMLRGELDAHVIFGELARHQIGERVVLRRQRLVHSGHHALVILRAGDRQHVRMRFADLLRALAQAAGDDDLAVLGHRLADGVQRLGHRRIDEAAGVHHHHVGIVVGLDDVVTLDPELGEDAFGVHQRLGAAETDETDLAAVGRGVEQGHGCNPARRDACAAEWAPCMQNGRAVYRPAPCGPSRRPGSRRRR